MALHSFVVTLLHGICCSCHHSAGHVVKNAVLGAVVSGTTKAAISNLQTQPHHEKPKPQPKPQPKAEEMLLVFLFILISREELHESEKADMKNRLEKSAASFNDLNRNIGHLETEKRLWRNAAIASIGLAITVIVLNIPHLIHMIASK